MAEATVRFDLGAETVTVVLPVDLPDGETIITGDFGGLIAAGTTARLRGNVNLTGNMHVRGTLLCDPTGVDLNGNGFDIHTHDGTLNLVGVEKTAWLTWGETPVGWQVGDRLAVAPTKVGVYAPSETTWQGSWVATTRPVNSPDVTLVDGTVARPEVANLSQTVILRNLQRVMIHEASAPNPQTLKWIRVLDSGETGVLGMYPIHFHMIGDHARGSVIEGVVVEGGKNHAFVPHASHGITQTGCVAYKTVGNPYWWDKPPEDDFDNTVNDTEDIVWDRCLALGASGSPAVGEQTRLTGFFLGAGRNMKCVDSVASCIAGTLSGGKETSGFHWPENADRNLWDFHHCVAHNNGNSGIFVWQNGSIHIIEDFVAYRNGYAGVNHGAYSNVYRYSRMVLSGDHDGLIQHAKSVEGRPPLIFEDIESDRPLTVTKHNSASTAPTFFRRCRFPQVRYGKLATPNPRTNNENSGDHGSHNIFEDCGLTPANFDLAGIKTSSIIEIFEGGVLMHRWQSGVWG